MSDNEPTIPTQTEPSWFWKIFGGAIVSVISILLLAHFTSINSNINNLQSQDKEIRELLDKQKERLAGLEQMKERQAVLEKSLSEVNASLAELAKSTAANTATTTSLDKELDTLTDSAKDIALQVQSIREKIVAEEAAKKAVEQPK